MSSSLRVGARVALAVVAAAALSADGPWDGAAPWSAPAARADDGTAPFDADSEPSGATVLVDGKPIGKTPVRDFPIAAGKRAIRIEAAEHEAFETTVEVTAGGRARVPTVKLVAWPKLVADPRADDATVTLDGAPLPASGRVVPGAHTVVFIRPGFAHQTVPVEVVSARDARVEAAPWSAFQARIDLTGLPKDAFADLDNVRVTGVLVFPGARKGTLRLTRPGHYPREVAVDLVLGATLVPGDDWVKIPALATSRAKGLTDATVNAAVKAGLDWLARHQSPDGRWDGDGFSSRCTGQACGGEGHSVFDPGVTGLAVQAFLGAGHTHVEGPHAAALTAAMKYLSDIQDSDGCFGPRTSQSFQYNHAAAATAMIEAFWITNDRRLRDSAAGGLRFTLASQNPYLAWRYGVRDGDNDTPTTIYQAIVVRTAEWTDLAPTPDWRNGAIAWMSKMTEPEFGKTGYQQRGGDPSRWTGQRGMPTKASSRGPRNVPFEVSREFPNTDTESLTAGTQLVRRLVAAEPDVFDGTDLDVAAVALVAKRLPFESDGWIDLHYALWGSLLHAQNPKAGLADWRKQTVAEVVARQFTPKYGCARGAWEASTDPFGVAGGRVYSTAMSLLTLSAPNRFPVVPPPPPKKPEKPTKPGRK